jgi:hypothetical protein
VSGAVVKVEGEGASKRLVVWFVAAPGVTFTADDLKAFLSSRLPPYLVPSQVIPLDAFPITVNGKVDRRALVVPTETTPVPSAAEPATPTEQIVRRAWQHVLGRERIGRYDNFFEIGGTSLRLIEVHHLLTRMLEREIAVADLFAYPALHSLASHLDEQPARPAAQAVVEGERHKQGVKRLKQMRAKGPKHRE